MVKYAGVPDGALFVMDYFEDVTAFQWKAVFSRYDKLTMDMRKTVLIITAGALLLCGCNGGKNMKDNSKNDAAIENIMNRTSVRSYEDRPVEKEKVETMLRAGMAAPSAKNVQPWELIVVDNDEVLAQMAAGLPYAKMLPDAPLAIIVCGDSDASSLWYLDCSAMAQNILLAAQAQGLGAVWTAAYPYEDRISVVSSALGLPENIVPLCVIPIGYPAKPHTAKDKWNEAKVRYNKW